MSAFSSIAHALECDWASKARSEQLPPPGNWTTWLVLAGRGWGKTRCGAENGSDPSPRPPAWLALPLWGQRLRTVGIQWLRAAAACLPSPRTAIGRSMSPARGGSLGRMAFKRRCSAAKSLTGFEDLSMVQPG
jgi:hypothetical protein